ncbi:unnamed protein product [Vitrella brassicaformis CCMP3155]|uniref:Uncharacterized protein n=1 Tax=Vitrella brassicaformis (strain CCMP3155) TaxID=1169540 RepID=A0A0G4EH54_VITBC|nr:unnamed protein product [Vitrella brassicaformis CCMP3155]|eukprot:CEL95344.1 unnamed protein product [Vitrella brassicaformis CCMP3155]
MKKFFNDQQWAVLDEMRQTLSTRQREAGWDPSPPSGLAPFVALNVGGRRFRARRQTLRAVPSSRLDELFSGRWERRVLKVAAAAAAGGDGACSTSCSVPDDEYFLDVDSGVFRKVLSRLQAIEGRHEEASHVPRQLDQDDPACVFYFDYLLRPLPAADESSQEEDASASSDQPRTALADEVASIRLQELDWERRLRWVMPFFRTKKERVVLTPFPISDGDENRVVSVKVCGEEVASTTDTLTGRAIPAQTPILRRFDSFSQELLDVPLEHFSLCVDFYRRCRFTRESGLSDLVWLPRVDIAEREGLRMALGMYGIDPHVPTCPQVPIVGTSRIFDDAAYVTNLVSQIGRVAGGGGQKVKAMELVYSASTDGWDKSTCLQHMSADDNPSSVLFILKTADGRRGGAFCEQLDIEASTVERVMCFGDTIAERFPSGHAPPCYYSNVNMRTSALMPSKPVITLAASDQSFDATHGGSVWGGSTNGTIWAGMTNGWGFELKIGWRGHLDIVCRRAPSEVMDSQESPSSPADASEVGHQRGGPGLHHRWLATIDAHIAQQLTKRWVAHIPLVTGLTAFTTIFLCQLSAHFFCHTCIPRGSSPPVPLWAPTISLTGNHPPERFIYAVGFSATALVMVPCTLMACHLQVRLRAKWTRIVLSGGFLLVATAGLFIQGVIPLQPDILMLMYGDRMDKVTALSLVHLASAGVFFVCAFIHGALVTLLLMQHKSPLIRMPSRLLKLGCVLVFLVSIVISPALPHASAIERLNASGASQRLCVLCIIVFLSSYTLDMVQLRAAYLAGEEESPLTMPMPVRLGAPSHSKSPPPSPQTHANPSE